MPVIPEVIETLKKLADLHKKKNDDYATDANPLSNFDDTIVGLKLFKNPEDQAFVWPVYCKLSRLANLLNSNATPNNESIEDSMDDIAMYMILWKAHWKRRELSLKSQPFDKSCAHVWKQAHSAGPIYCIKCGEQNI